MTYGWEFMHICNEIAQGKQNLADIDKYLAKQDTLFPRSAYRMYFTTNHDENSWNGTGFERHGNFRQLMEVLTYTIHGMPLIYSGQEGGETYPDGKVHRYSFFEKDTVRFNDYKYQDFYARLLHLHRNNPALWNGEFGGEFKRLKTSNDDVLYCYSRKKDDNEVIVLLNFSDKPRGVDFVGEIPDGEYQSIFDTRSLTLYTKGNQELPPYGYQVLVKGSKH
jgi:glycosidase